jgi:hypothetical protein
MREVLDKLATPLAAFKTRALIGGGSIVASTSEGTGGWEQGGASDGNRAARRQAMEAVPAMGKRLRDVQGELSGWVGWR